MKIIGYARRWLSLIAGLILLLGIPASPVVAAGAITLNPTSGTVGTTVTVTGSGFPAGDNYTIQFAGLAAGAGAINTSGELTINITVPTYPRGQYTITTTTTSNATASQSFTITPTITLNPSSARPGSQILVSGTGFQASSIISIVFDTSNIGNVITNSIGSFTNLSITIPSTASGSHAITGRDDTGSSPAVTFSTQQAVITLSKSSGNIGDQITVSGSGFRASSSVSILFDSTSLGAATTDIAGAFTNFTIKIPGSSKGSHVITGQDSTGASLGVTFEIQQPTISISQTSGRVGDQITVSGAGFKPSSSVSILFDGASVGSVTTDTTGSFTGFAITIPSGSQGTHTITGKDANNTSLGKEFIISQSLSVSPLSATVGGAVTVKGSGFDKKATITIDFDGTPLQTTATTDAAGAFTASFTVPEAAGGTHLIDIRDNSNNGDTVSFTVTQKLSITPDTGPSGTMIKVDGAGFAANQPVTIKFNGTPVSLVPSSVSTGSQGSFSATFEVPACLPGSYGVEATIGSQTASAKFSSALAATISQTTSEASPGHVGMQLTISGVGFKPNVTVTITRATIQQPMGTAKTTAQGAFSIDFTLPPSPAGHHTLIVTDGENTRQFDLFIEKEAPSSPSLLKPDSGKKSKEPVVFNWKGITDISGVTYTLQVSKNENFASVILEQDGLKQNEFTVPEGELEAVTKENPYYWRVKTVDGASNESDWSETRSFSTGLMFTLPNGEPELTLSAWMTYLAGAGIILLIVLSFLIGRKTNSY